MQDMNSTDTFTCEDFFYSEWTIDDINDERLGVETFATSATGIGTSITSSLISTSASILVIYIIMRSVNGLKSVYHRILCGMSVFDILQSLAIAFVTLPMPKDMIYQQFQGLVLGNDFTCRTQGFFVTVGSISGVMYNLMLSIYYLCSIRYDMSDDVFSKRLEPWLHAISVFLGVLVASFVLYGDGMKPNPAQSNWCATNSYPYYCSSSENVYKSDFRVFTGFFISAIAVIALVVLLSSMILIVLKVRRQEKHAIIDDDLNIGDEQTSPLRAGSRVSASVGIQSRSQTRMQEQLLHEKRTISRQALAYTIVNLFNYVMIFAVPIARGLMDNPIPPPWWQVMALVLRPLQGLLNCIIFIYHKVDGLLENNEAQLFWPALKKVLRGEEGQVRIVSDLMMVRHHTVLSNIQFADDPNIVEFVGDEDDEDDEGNSSSLPMQGDENRATSSVSTNPKIEQAAVEETDEEANNIRGEQLSPISATTTSNINVNSSTNTNGPDGETSAQAEHSCEEQRMYYQYLKIQPKLKSSELDDGQESSQDLSGFQSSSLASGSLPFSLKSNDSNGRGV